MRQHVNELVGRELSDEEFGAIDFSGAIEEAEFCVGDLPKFPWALPLSIIVGGIACDLLGISYRTSAFLGILMGLILVFFSLEIALVRRGKRAVAKRLVEDAIRKYEERKQMF